MVFLLTFITLAAALSQLIAFRRMLKYVAKELQFTPGAYMPKVSVILPCKGVDPGFADNIARLLAQEYKNQENKPLFEVIFAVASENDPAYPLLKEACARGEQVRTQLVVAGTNPHRAQKVNNQLAALELISAESEVLVFVDSDVIARSDFLAYLVGRLDDQQIGATTGYRFYIPFKGDWPSLIRSLWNRMTAWEMASSHAFAWGGAMAARRAVFDRARVKESWQRSADDDLALTTAIKKLGLRIHFVPQCLVATHGDGTLGEIVEWTNRQLILTKVYYPELWRRAIVRAVVLTVWLFAVIVSVFNATLLHQPEMLKAAAIGLCLLPIELAFLIKAQGLWQSVLQANTAVNRSSRFANSNVASDQNQIKLEKAYRQSLWRFSVVLPLAHLVLPWMTLYSLLTNRIKWRGITYELRSPTETLII